VNILIVVVWVEQREVVVYVDTSAPDILVYAVSIFRITGRWRQLVYTLRVA
jgi:hypothetical protein